MKEKLKKYFTSKHFVKYFIIMIILAIIGEIAISIYEYDMIIWPLVIPMIIGDFFSTFFIFDVVKKASKKEK